MASQTLLTKQPHLQRAIIRLLLSKDDANLQLAVTLLNQAEAPPLVRAALLVAAHQARRSDSQQLFLKHCLRNSLPGELVSVYDKLFYVHHPSDPYPGPNGLHVNSLTRLLSLDAALDGMEIARLMWQTDDVRLQACAMHFWLLSDDERKLFYLLDNLKAGDLQVEKQHKRLRFYARLQEAIEAFRRMEILHFEGRDQTLDRFPTVVKDFTLLEELSLTQHAFSRISREVLALPKLQKLDLSRNRFTSFPLFSEKLTALHYLDLSFQQEAWQDYSGDLSALQKLKSLKLRGNQLREIPDAISQLTSLVHLDLRGNHIREIPAFLHEMPRLISVDLRENGMEKLDATLPNHLTLKL